MAILRSVDGKFYDVPDTQLEQFLVPADKVKDKLQGALGPQSGPPPGGRGPGRGAAAPVVIQIFGGAGVGMGGAPAPAEGAPAGGDVTPYHCWRNCWRNCH